MDLRRRYGHDAAHRLLRLVPDRGHVVGATDVKALLTEAIAVAIAAALIFGTAYLLGRSHGAAGEREAWQERVTAANTRVREIEKERFRAAEIVARNHAAEMEKVRATATAARGELDRLRDVLADRDRADAAGAGPRLDGAAIERQLFAECAAAIAELAGEADADAARLRGWQHRARTVEGVAP